MNKKIKYFLIFFLVTICYGFICSAIWVSNKIELSDKLFWTGMLTMVSYGIPGAIVISISEESSNNKKHYY